MSPITHPEDLVGLAAASALSDLEPPTFVHEGRTYVGEFMSVLRWCWFQRRIERLADGKLGLVQVLRLFRQLCDRWFPPPKRRWFLGPRVEPSVATIVSGLPLNVQSAVIARWLGGQGRAFGLDAVRVEAVLACHRRGEG